MFSRTWCVVVTSEEDGATTKLGIVEVSTVHGRMTIKIAPSDHAGHIADIVGPNGSTITRTRLRRLISEGTLVSAQHFE